MTENSLYIRPGQYNEENLEGDGNMPAPLDGVRVLDLSQLFPGPYCTMILADLGAEVIKVEPPGIGDYARLFGYFFDQINRNKKSVALNLKDQAAQEAFHLLVRDADVIVEGFRPGTTARLGVDYETLRGINPGIIYCSISGFGQDGPYMQKPAHDINYMSLAGALGLTRDREGRPVVLGLEIVDITSGLNSVIGIMAALLAREKSGAGQQVDISMLDCALSLLPMEAGYCLATGDSPDESPLKVLPHYDVFATGDGEWLVLGIVHEDWFWKELCDAIDLPDLRELNVGERIGRSAEIASRLREAISSRSLADLLGDLEGRDVPFSKLNSVGEALHDPQILHRRMVITLPGSPDSGVYVGSPLKLSETEVRFHSPSPHLGEHTDSLLSAAGLTAGEIKELRDCGAIQ
jgi:crotonobetainyl-CoA:carnitine CoA-transferase CaiB-like acyl-CoA transferase